MVFISEWFFLFLNYIFFSDCKVFEPEAVAKDEEVSAELWDTSCVLVNLEPSVDPFQPEKDDVSI